MQGPPYQIINHFHICFPYLVYLILRRGYSYGTMIELLEKGDTNMKREP